ncbi:MAG: monofunctional biosynthetic peptidoglycan transglycosylase [Balneolaceae bacterium]
MEHSASAGPRRNLGIAAGILAGFALVLVLSIVSLRWINPPFTAFTLQENWDALEMDRYSLRENWVSGEELPEHLKWAVVASEDQRFWDHRGIDMLAIDDALEEFSRGERRRGASTITQQVAKNLYLWPSPSVFRKGIEAGLAVMIDFFWTKERILEMYLNIAEFGPGIFGVGRAAPVLLSIPPAGLDADASARLAAVLPSPKRMRVEPPSPYTVERSRWILRQMSRLTGSSYLPEPERDTTDFVPDSDPLPWDFGREPALDGDEDSTSQANGSIYDRNGVPDSLPDTLR